MPDKVPAQIVRERAHRLRTIGAELTRRFRASQVGRIHDALTIENGNAAVTGNYLKVRIPAGCARNEWVRVRVSDDGGQLAGTILSS
jgi:tRNA A37 methylthiotransferase MiaB